MLNNEWCKKLIEGKKIFNFPVLTLIGLPPGIFNSTVLPPHVSKRLLYVLRTIFFSSPVLRELSQLWRRKFRNRLFETQPSWRNAFIKLKQKYKCSITIISENMLEIKNPIKNMQNHLRYTCIRFFSSGFFAYIKSRLARGVKVLTSWIWISKQQATCLDVTESPRSGGQIWIVLILDFKTTVYRCLMSRCCDENPRSTYSFNSLFLC